MATKPVLSMCSITAGYGKLSILHDVSLDVVAQRFTAILGPNGSGKSTLLKSIFGLATVMSGSIRIHQRDLIGLPTETVGACGIAYVPQHRNVFTDMTVREHLLLAVRHQDRATATRLLDEMYALFPLLKKRPHQNAGHLSGGERQMLAIAMGWLGQPEVMLLDEPTAGLSPLYATEVFKTLRSLCDRMSLLVVEQNARSVLRWCDDVVILREGKLVYSGESDDNILHEYLGVHIPSSVRVNRPISLLSVPL